MATTRASLWLVVVATLAGCGKSQSRLEAVGEAGGAPGEPDAGKGGAGAHAGAGTTGGAGGRGGSGASGAPDRPVDPSLTPPSLRLPQNGRATGSVWAEPTRRPRFVWDAQPDVTFEIEVDDSCDIGALESCEFPSPEWTSEALLNEQTPPDDLPVSERAPVGRRYYWHVRACTSAACSPWSMVRYVDVGRQRSDFDGDGYADVVLSNAGNSAVDGRVLVGFGPEPSSRLVVLEDATRAGTPDRFGTVAKALGDMDGDGFADLLVTAAGDPMNLTGEALVFFGSATFSDAASVESLLVQGGEGERLGGVAVAAGDVDGDGMQDFATDTYPADARLFRGD
ncbi:MAG TPA: VCBS repeat-containing protein, partial [Polyangiaceae bacterium]